MSELHQEIAAAMTPERASLPVFAAAMLSEAGRWWMEAWDRVALRWSGRR